MSFRSLNYDESATTSSLFHQGGRVLVLGLRVLRLLRIDARTICDLHSLGKYGMRLFARHRIYRSSVGTGSNGRERGKLPFDPFLQSSNVCCLIPKSTRP